MRDLTEMIMYMFIDFVIYSLFCGFVELNTGFGKVWKTLGKGYTKACGQRMISK